MTRRGSPFPLALALCVAVPGLAQPEPPPTSRPSAAEPDALTPPAVVDQPPLRHPLPDEEARALGPAEVTVLVEVDEQGLVSSAELVDEESHPSPALRRAAMAVAAATLFRPATRAGEPTPVRVPMALTFTPPPPPAEEETAPMEIAQAGADGETDAETSAAGAAPAAAPEQSAADAARPPAMDDDLDGGFGSVADEVWRPSVAGQTAVVAGGLLTGTAFLVALFTGVTAIDNAARVEELAQEDKEELAEAARGRTHGTWMVVPVVGPFGAAFTAPDATTLMLSLGIGVGQVVGLLAVAAGAALWTYGALAE